MLSLCLAAAPAIDLVALWNQVDAWKIDPKTLAVSSPSDPCVKDLKAEVDLENLFIAVDGAAGPKCEEKQRTELTVFTRTGKSGDPLLVRSTYGLFSKQIESWTVTDGKLVTGPNALDAVMGVALLPAELQRNGIDVQYLEPTYVLPQHGTTLTVLLNESAITSVCKDLKPKPAACAPAAVKKALTLKAKWNAKEGRFELKP